MICTGPNAIRLVPSLFSSEGGVKTRPARVGGRNMGSLTDTHKSIMAKGRSDRRLSAPRIGTAISSPLSNYFFCFLREIVSHECSGLLAAVQK
jgi:hypothetical protein